MSLAYLLALANAMAHVPASRREYEFSHLPEHETEGIRMHGNGGLIFRAPPSTTIGGAFHHRSQAKRRKLRRAAHGHHRF
jgi:hypothetical protein